MALIYLSPEFPPGFKNFIIQLKKKGVAVYGLGEADFFSMTEELRSSLTWYEKTNLNNFDDVKRNLDKIFSTVGKTFGDSLIVESHNEHWLRLESMINQYLQLDGLSIEQVNSWKKKSEMKKLFLANHIKVPRGEMFTDLVCAVNFGKKVGYPFILKPDEGVGASGVFKVNSVDELKKIVDKLHGSYFMEEFIDGTLVSFDGLVDKKGNVLFENSLVYSHGVLEFVNGRDPFFYMDRYIDPVLSNLGRKIVGIFNIKQKFFHFEFFKVDDTYYPLEVNCRPPGGPIMDMMNYTIDDDLYEAYANVVADIQTPIKNDKKYYCAYVGRREKHYHNSNESIFCNYGGEMISHYENPHLYHEAMGKYVYLFRSPDFKKINEIRSFIMT